MNKGLVSIVVPIFNVEPFLDRCLNSIVNQTYRNLEIILVDDGSPDNCPRMCDAWAAKDRRIRVIHKENEGLGMARNTGIENATGEYICFFDSDDYVSLDTVEKAYLRAKSQSADVVIFGIFRVNSCGKVVTKFAPETTMQFFEGSDIQKQFLPDLIDNRYHGTKTKNLCLSACSCLFSMALIERVNWRFVSERNLISEDSYSMIWLYKYVKKVSVLTEALYYYCDNEGSLSQSYRPDRYDKIRLFYIECQEMARLQGYNKEVQSAISRLFLAFSIAAMKQIAAAKLPQRARLQNIRIILNDKTMCKVLEENGTDEKGFFRRILFYTMNNRMYRLCHWLLSAKNAADRR